MSAKLNTWNFAVSAKSLLLIYWIRQGRRRSWQSSWITTHRWVWCICTIESFPVSRLLIKRFFIVFSVVDRITIEDVSCDILPFSQAPPYMDGDHMKLKRLEMAIDYKQKKARYSRWTPLVLIPLLFLLQFVAHPNIQQLLASLWYEGRPDNFCFHKRINNLISIKYLPRCAGLPAKKSRAKVVYHLKSGDAVSVLLSNVHVLSLLQHGENHQEAFHEISDSRQFLPLLPL